MASASAAEGSAGESLTYQAGLAHPLGGTVAPVPVHQVLAGASVVAGVRSTVVIIWAEGIRLFLKVRLRNTCSFGGWGVRTDGAGGAAPAWCTLTLVALTGF